MGRKIAIAVAITIFLAGIGLGYFMLKSKDKVESVDAFHAIPEDAQLVVRVNRVQYVGQVLSWFQVKEAESVFSLLSKRLPTERTTGSLSKSPYLIISSHPQDSASLSGLIYYVVFPTEGAVSSFAQSLINGEAPNHVRSNTSVSGDLMFENGVLLHFQQMQRFVVLSTSKQLVDASVKQWEKEGSLKDGEAFAAALNVAGRNADANIFINGSSLAGITNSLWGNRDNGVLNLFADTTSHSWTQLDASMDKELCTFSGFLMGKGLASISNPLFAGASSESELGKYLPAATAYAMITELKNVDSTLSYYETTSGKEVYSRNIAALSDSANVNIRSFFTEIAPQELALAFVPTDGGRGDWLSMVKVASIDVALERLKELSKESGVNPVRGMISGLFGGLFKQNSEAYYSSVGSYLIFSGSKRLLEEVKATKKSLQTVLSDSRFTSYMMDSARIMGYINPALLSKTISLSKLALQNKLVFQLSSTNGKLYCSAVTAMNSKPEWRIAEPIDADNEEDVQDTTTTSSTQEKSTAITSLKLFRKSVTEGKSKYVLEQSGDFSLAITKKNGGTVNVSADGVILNAELFDINGKGSYGWVFNTASKLYMLNAEGKLAKGFPCTLPAKATNGVAIFDYGNTFDYRIFVACSDKKLYLFDKAGKQVDGWEPKQTESEVTKPVYFFRLLDKDYIVCADKDNVYILDRRGNNRVTPKEKVSCAENSKLSGLVNPSRIVCTDTDGREVSIYLSDGRVVRK